LKTKPSTHPLKFATVAMLCASLAFAPVQALTPVINLSDLVNQDSDYAQRELRGRGYVYIHADLRGSKTWQYWWQPRDTACVRVTHLDGRAANIVSAGASDCNQHPQQGRSDGMSDGAKVALGAAAILGVAALAHKSHERDENKHRTAEQVAEYERGYRDGLYHQPYHDYNRSASYVDGYNAGQQKREAETSYRSPHGHHSGHAPYVNLNDLVGARASSADSELRQRGFTDRGGYKSGSKAFGTWWNASTRQCVQAVVSDGRLQALKPIYEGNCL
jgi:hypothetical protein